MASTSYIKDCPMCGGDMDCTYSNKLYESASGECLSCGFTYWTTDGQMSLEEVNERREENEQEPLKELKKHKHELVS